MVIHTVKAGETIYSIARTYGVPAPRLISDNGLTTPDELAVGQTIVILYHDKVHIVTEGETLTSIAEANGTTVYQLLRNNPALDGLPQIYPGQALVVSYSGAGGLGDYSITGYAYQFIDRDVLRKTLPYLTYLTVFGYGFHEDGTLVSIDDDEVVDSARAYGVGPILLLSTIGDDGKFNSARSTALIQNSGLASKVTDALLEVMRSKGYVGIDVDFEYIPATDREAYIEFLRALTDRMHAEGYTVSVDLAPKTRDDMPGLLYEGLDYKAIGEIVDFVLLMTYEYGYKYSEPMAVAPIPEVRAVLEYAVTQIPREKINMGVPNYAYDWPLPYVKGETAARTLGVVEATEQAFDVGSEILYDERARSPYYNYTRDAVRHEVWLENANSIDAKLRLAAEFELNGVSVWNVMKFFPGLWLVGNQLYNIRRGNL